MITEFFDRPIFVTGEQTDNKKIEEDIVKSIPNEEKKWNFLPILII